ncbi:hypothetical protein [uncultured Methanobacterium sp.]|uniref:hypothetical protein n=1 Tax=uncultured Methanobacterium sp. TaxID=176306 RepID=UPI002AA80658|nr:hypothetical protein [uncultured Methanobacterium sp.]
MRVKELTVTTDKPDVREIVVEVTPRMDKIGPEFKGQAPVIVKYLQSSGPQEIAENMEKDGFIDIEGSQITADHISTTKELVGRTGEKVELILDGRTGSSHRTGDLRNSNLKIYQNQTKCIILR